MAKTRIIYELSEEQITEIFRLWLEDAARYDPNGKTVPSATVNAGVFITYALRVGA